MTARNERRSYYYDLCKGMGKDWLQSCAKDPSAYMRPRHIALILLVIRNKTYAAI